MKKIFLIIFIFLLSFGISSANQNIDCSGPEYASLGIIEIKDRFGNKKCVKREYTSISGNSTGTFQGGHFRMYRNASDIFYNTYISDIIANDFYPGFFGSGNYLGRRGLDIGVTLKPEQNKKVGVVVYLKVNESGEYLITGGGDDIFTIKINGDVIIKETNYRNYRILPIYLSKGDNYIEFLYEKGGNLQSFAGEIVGPFLPGSFINNSNNGFKSINEIKSFIYSQGNKNYRTSRASINVNGPNAYLDKVIWNTRQIYGKSGITISDNIDRAGFFCPDGYYLGLKNPTNSQSRKAIVPDICIKYVPINQEDINNALLLNNDYKADGFFTKTDTINVGNTERTYCPSGFSFPRDNSTNIYKPKENNFKCITPDPEIHKTTRKADNEPYRIKVGQNSGITSCGHGAKVVGFNRSTNIISCERTLSDLNGSYAKAFENKEIYIYSYNEGLKYKGGIMEMGLEQENSKNNYDNKFAEGRFIGPISFRNVSTDSYKDDLKAGNYREYTIKFDKMCVGFNIGCKTNKPENININVYANNLVANAGNTSTDYNKFTNGSLFANGQKQDLVYKPIDNFNNYILPVKKESGEKIRDLNFEIFYKNSLYANQYNKTGASGIKSTTFYNNVEAWDNSLLGIKSSETKISKRLDETSIKDGQYKLSFKAYTPTYKENTTDGRQYAYGNVELFRPTIKLSDNSNVFSLGGNLNLQFKPKFVTSIIGSIINDGLVVGTRQDSNLQVTGVGKPNDILIEYGKLVGTEKKSHDNFYLNINKSGSWENVVSGRQNNSSTLTKTGLVNDNNTFSTLLRQKGSITNLNDKTYIATHIRDIIDGVEFVYSSFAIGLNNYERGEGDNVIENTFQRRIKISGTVHTHSKSEVFNTEKIFKLGNIDKSELQKHIRKRVVDNIRNLNITSKTLNSNDLNLTSFTANSGKKVGDTLYFEKNDGSNIEIKAGSYSGVKNIVIYGGNAYITGNITAGNKKNDILSIISVEKNGKGGNIYIKPNVTNIDSVLYADKSVLSYEYLIPNGKFDFNYKELKNQLKIYGSVFSNNTIGGSIMTDNNGNPTPKCPYHIPKNDCTATEGDKVGTSEKYDLYNLRRGYENLYKPGTDVYKNENLKDEYKKSDGAPKDELYTLIIEYNPLIQSSKNPFFTVKK